MQSAPTPNEIISIVQFMRNNGITRFSQLQTLQNPPVYQYQLVSSWQSKFKQGIHYTLKKNQVQFKYKPANPDNLKLYLEDLFQHIKSNKLNIDQFTQLITDIIMRDFNLQLETSTQTNIKIQNKPISTVPNEFMCYKNIEHLLNQRNELIMLQSLHPDQQTLLFKMKHITIDQLTIVQQDALTKTQNWPLYNESYIEPIQSIESNTTINLTYICTKNCGAIFTTKGSRTRHSNKCLGPE